MKFRLVGLRALMLAAVFAIALAPVSALADANPSNHGHHYHYGWVHHHTPPVPPTPAPVPGGGGTGNGPSNNVRGVVPGAVALQAPQAPTVLPPETPVLQPPSSVVTTVQPLLEGQNVWLVAILLASFLAANVAAVVLLTGRAGHYAIGRALAPVGIRL